MAERGSSKESTASKQTIKKSKPGRSSTSSVGRGIRVSTTKTRATEKTTYRSVTSRYNSKSTSCEKVPSIRARERVRES